MISCQIDEMREYYIFDENVQMLNVVLSRCEDGGVTGHYGISMEIILTFIDFMLVSLDLI